MAEPGVWVRLPHNHHETRIFENSLEDYLRNNNLEGFWGPVTATIDWCERQYSVCYYIAEFWNCISNVFYISVALWGLLMVSNRNFEFRHTLVFIGYLLIGFGSALYHGSLLFHYQILDELPMMICVLTNIWSCLCIDPATERKYKKFFDFFGELLALTFILFCYLHWQYQYVKFFQTAFGVLTLTNIGLVVRECWKPQTASDVIGRKMGYSYGIAVLVAAICWLLDQIFCVQLSRLPYYNELPIFQLHSYWHFFTAVACLCSALFLMIRRAWYFGEEPRVEWTMGFLPYVVRGKTNRFKY